MNVRKKVYPLVQEIAYQDSSKLFIHFSHLEGAVFLDSAELREGCGEFSFIAIDPFLVIKNADWNFLQITLEKYFCHTLPDLPPFQGGMAGFIAYDFYFESIKSKQQDDMHFPNLVFGFYDVVMGFDHKAHRAFLFSSGFPELDTQNRMQRAQKRLQFFLQKLNDIPFQASLSAFSTTMQLHSNFTGEQYSQAVEKVKRYILEGDIFEANISQRFITKFAGETYTLYSRLREKSRAPFSAFLRFDNVTLASASPERFLKVTNGVVETRPIKGTRKRGASLEEDKKLADELLLSEKDIAENVMIVDLQRNDLSRVCEPYSVKVLQLCQLESYTTVHHLVSVVIGKLKQNVTALELLAASFPGGSITGAPKIRAMEIIAEIEPTRRGPYCGSIGYIGFNGEMDMSIVIRTYAIKNNTLTFQVGGAITMDSNPLEEYNETLTKAKLLIETLNDFSH